jgi:hypothetical protein
MAAILTSHKIINQGSICRLPSLLVCGVFLIFLGLRQRDARRGRDPQRMGGSAWFLWYLWLSLDLLLDTQNMLNYHNLLYPIWSYLIYSMWNQEFKLYPIAV